MLTRTRRAHYLFAASLFSSLGFHAGVWAVQLAQLAAGLRLDPARLGAAVTAITGLHAWFSGRAPAGALGSAVALSAGVGYREVRLIEGKAFVIMKCLLKRHVRKTHPPPQAHFPRVPGAFIADRITVGRYLRYGVGKGPR